MACNEMKKIGDSYYAFDGSGAMQTGWHFDQKAGIIQMRMEHR